MMKPKHTISAIVPCYNVAAYIGICLDSLLAQGDILAEIICVDDCSTDETAGIIAAHMQQHPGKIRLIRNEKNSGASFSRNRAIAEAQGDYLQLLDADDFLLEGKILRQLTILEEQDAPDLIAADYIRRYADGKDEHIVAEKNDVWISLMRTRLGCTCSNLWKRQALLDAGGFDVSMPSSQEYHLMFRMLKNKARVVFDNQPLMVALERSSGSISSAQPARKWQRYVQLRIDIIHFLRSEGLLEQRAGNAYQVLFDAIRTWYAHDAASALAAWKKEIPKDFRPQPSAVTSPLYCRIYRVFGFRMAERIRKWMGK